MDDSEGKGEMYLTEKKRKRKMMESSLNNTICDDDKSSGKSLEELESLLEAYFVFIDSVLSKLITVCIFIYTLSPISMCLQKLYMEKI